MKLLVTGGLGYIGSHFVVESLTMGCEVVVIDNLSNSSIDVKDKIEKITKTAIKFFEADIRDTLVLSQVLKEENVDLVVHFAGVKSVHESTTTPLKYYDHNVAGTLSLLKAMDENNVHNLIFSSSAAVYGTPKYLPIDEDHYRSAQSPYGNTKLQIECILEDLHNSNPEWSICMLRYFNPLGSHDSGLLGDAPAGIPNNLMPYIANVAIGVFDHLMIYGNDYDTSDGTGVRDYIHVVDLAKGHLDAIGFILESKNIFEAINLGTGLGTSVLELVQVFEKVNHIKIPKKIAPRRKGDVASCYSEVSKSKKVLNWKAERSLQDMVRSSFQYAQREALK